MAGVGSLTGPGSNEDIQRVVLEPALSRRRKACIVRQSCITNEPGEGTPGRVRGAAYDAPGILSQAGIASPAGHYWDRDCPLGVATVPVVK